MALRGGGIDRRRRSVSWVMGLSIVGSKMRKAPSSFRMRGLLEKVLLYGGGPHPAVIAPIHMGATTWRMVRVPENMKLPF